MLSLVVVAGGVAFRHGEGRQFRYRGDEQDQDRPCWTYLSEDVGFDCSNMVLHDFFDYLKSDHCVLDSQQRADILECIEEEWVDVKNGLSMYSHLYQ